MGRSFNITCDIMSSLNSYLMSRISSASLENYFSFARVRCKKITVMELRRAFQNYVKTFFVEVLIGLGNPFLVVAKGSSKILCTVLL